MTSTLQELIEAKAEEFARAQYDQHAHIVSTHELESILLTIAREAYRRGREGLAESFIEHETEKMNTTPDAFAPSREWHRICAHRMGLFVSENTVNQALAGEGIGEDVTSLPTKES